MRRWTFLLPILLLLLPLSTMATSFHELADIEARVKEHVEVFLSGIYGSEKIDNDITIRLSNIDGRLKLPQCPLPLELGINETAFGAQKINVSVKCPSASKWKIYVPTRIDIYEYIAVSNRNLHRGEQVTEQDFSFKRTNTAKLGSNYIASPQHIIDKQVKRQIRSGSIIQTQDLQEPLLVNKGDTVVVTAIAGNLQVTTEGTALSNGQMGQQIRIRNLRSKRIIDALVTGPGIAEINGW